MTAFGGVQAEYERLMKPLDAFLNTYSFAKLGWIFIKAQGKFAM